MVAVAEEVSVTDLVFEKINSEMATNGGELGNAVDVAIVYLRKSRNVGAFFDENAKYIVQHLWNNRRGSYEIQQEPQEHGSRSNAKERHLRGGRRVDLYGAMGTWVSIGPNQQARLGDFTVELAIRRTELYRQYKESHAEMEERWDAATKKLKKAGKGKTIKDVMTEEEAAALV
jgi:hypothetical protein